MSYRHTHSISDAVGGMISISQKEQLRGCWEVQQLVQGHKGGF